MISIVLCDDEDIFLDKYESIIKNYFKTNSMSYELVKFRNTETLLFHLEDNPYRFEFYILDVLMPKVTGIEISSKIRKINNDAKIIFLTSTPDFVFEAFDVSPINYLLKGKDDQKLIKILNEFLLKRNEISNDQNFVYHSKNNIISIPYTNIIYFEIFHRIITIHCAKDQKYEFYCSLKELEQIIDTIRFVRIFRSYIVNMQYIKRINKHQVELKNGIILPISRDLYDDVKKKFINFINETI